MKEKGISLVEIVLVAAAVIALALLLGTLPSSMSSINKSRHASIAREIAAREIEYIKKQPYENFLEGVNTFTDLSLNNLASGSAYYEIKACPAEICTNEEEMKEVKVSVSWSESGEPVKVELVTLIYAGGIGQ